MRLLQPTGCCGRIWGRHVVVLRPVGADRGRERRKRRRDQPARFEGKARRRMSRDQLEAEETRGTQAARGQAPRFDAGAGRGRLEAAHGWIVAALGRAQTEDHERGEAGAQAAQDLDGQPPCNP